MSDRDKLFTMRSTPLAGTAAGRGVLVAGVCIVIAVLCRFAISSERFTLVSPYPFVVTAAWILLVGGNTGGADDLSRIESALIIPLAFVVWSLPLLRGATVIPTRSRWAALVMALLSCAYFVWGAKYAIRFQGSDHTFGVIAANALICAALFALYVRNRHHAAFATNLLFHALLFAWLGTYAFPFMGEGP